LANGDEPVVRSYLIDDGVITEVPVALTEPLVCPGAATTHGLDERFCPSCGMPLVYAGRPGSISL
jgi:hypothetical protein